MNISFGKLETISRFKYHIDLQKLTKNFFWFLIGGLISLFLLVGIGYLSYQSIYHDKVYPSIFIEGKDFGGQKKEEVRKFFDERNKKIGESSFILQSEYGNATVSAKEIEFGYDSNLIAEQAYLLGRSNNFLSNLSIVSQAYLTGIKLPASYSMSEKKLSELIKPIKIQIDKRPVNAEFKFESGRVTAFKPSQNGRAINTELLSERMRDKTLAVISSKKAVSLVIPIPVKTLEPEIETEEANKFGIKELIGTGSSLFYHSIPNRIYNLQLAANRLNGVLIKPGEVFSFNKSLGDVSAFTGYKQAYVIQNGKTVLGDGGGVCQVSTTFFRALLNAGLPIIERNPHAYRVGYYELDSSPGVDAAIYTPTVDLKFKNDTANYILVQSEVDLNNLSLKFYLYGTKDGRTTSIGNPVIYNQSPAPAAEYQDDPTLPIGTIKQIDFAAPGASVYFTRTVTKDGKKILEDKFISNYRPWRAVFLRGTKSE